MTAGKNLTTATIVDIIIKIGSTRHIPIITARSHAKVKVRQFWHLKFLIRAWAISGIDRPRD